MATTIDAAGQTDVGCVRTNNEDSFFVDRPGVETYRSEVGRRGVLLGVSDGVGGELAGELASVLTLGAMWHRVRTYLPDKPPAEALRRGIEDANTAVHNESERSPDRRGMAATLTAMLVLDDCAFIAEVGDSRAYLVRAGQITQITHDQSYVQMLLDARAITIEEAKRSPHKNVILQAIGNTPKVDVVITRVALRRGDRLLLCTDGLSNMATDEEMLEAVEQGGENSALCTALIELAKVRGAEDNVTLICASVDGDLPAPRADEFVLSTFSKN